MVFAADGERGVLVVNATRARLARLRPHTLYSLSIAALNAAGPGNATLIRATTGKGGDKGGGEGGGTVQRHPHQGHHR